MKTIIFITLAVVVGMLLSLSSIDWSSWVKGLACGGVISAWVVYFGLGKEFATARKSLGGRFVLNRPPRVPNA